MTYFHRDPELTRTVNNLAILAVARSKRKPVVTEYIDVTTGEIITAEAAYKLGVRSIRPDAMLRRTAKLNSLRKETRVFADFLLKFRDHHCKFLAPIDTLLSWYSKLSGKETKNIKRYLPTLISAGILDPDLMLNEDFMINNHNAGKGEVKGDLFRAYVIFDLMMLRKNSSLK